MASISAIKSKKIISSGLKSPGFSMLETAVSMSVFIVAIGIGISSYINLIAANSTSQNVYTSVENLSLGLEKIWKDLKYGSEFTLANSELEFKDRACSNIKLRLNSETGTFEYIKNNSISSLNDSSIAFIKKLNFLVSNDKTSITIFLGAEIKSKTKNIPINLQISVAPINAPFNVEKCPAQ